VKYGIQCFAAHLVQRGQQTFPRDLPVVGGVLEAIGDPDVHDTAVVECLADAFTDASASCPVVDPETTDCRIDMAQRESVSSLRMREEARVEVDAQLPLFGPGNPVLKMVVLSSWEKSTYLLLGWLIL